MDDSTGLGLLLLGSFVLNLKLPCLAEQLCLDDLAVLQEECHDFLDLLHSVVLRYAGQKGAPSALTQKS